MQKSSNHFFPNKDLLHKFALWLIFLLRIWVESYFNLTYARVI